MVSLAEKPNNPFDFSDFTEFNLSPAVILWIYKNLPFGSTILELGSGKSSRELTKLYTVYSVEENKKYCGLYNCNYIYAPIKNGWYDTALLKNGLPRNYNLLIIDGPKAFNPWNPFSFTRRIKFVENFNIFEKDKIMIFDDYNRKLDQWVVNQINKILRRSLEVIEDKKKKACVMAS